MCVSTMVVVPSVSEMVLLHVTTYIIRVIIRYEIITIPADLLCHVEIKTYRNVVHL